VFVRSLIVPIGDLEQQFDEALRVLRGVEFMSYGLLGGRAELASELGLHDEPSKGRHQCRVVTNRHEQPG